MKDNNSKKLESEKKEKCCNKCEPEATLDHECCCSADTELLIKETQEANDRYLRAIAEMENVRRRAAKECEESAKFGASALAKDVIVFVDNLERAVACSPKGDLNAEVKSFIEGVSIMTQDVLTALERHGVKKVETDGVLFNPEIHQAVSEVPATEEEKPGFIKSTMQNGYTINGRLLRAAMVVVIK